MFVHGWRHNGRSDDSNLESFRELLTQTSLDAAGRPVFGVFVAWRGLSWYGPDFLPVDYATFWTRKEAALRVALGSVRELFGSCENSAMISSESPTSLCSSLSGTALAV